MPTYLLEYVALVIIPRGIPHKSLLFRAIGNVASPIREYCEVERSGEGDEEVENEESHENAYSGILQCNITLLK